MKTLIVSLFLFISIISCKAGPYHHKSHYFETHLEKSQEPRPAEILKEPKLAEKSKEPKPVENVQEPKPVENSQEPKPVEISQESKSVEESKEPKPVEEPKELIGLSVSEVTQFSKKEESRPILTEVTKNDTVKEEVSIKSTKSDTSGSEKVKPNPLNVKEKEEGHNKEENPLISKETIIPEPHEQKPDKQYHHEPKPHYSEDHQDHYEHYHSLEAHDDDDDDEDEHSELYDKLLFPLLTPYLTG